MTLFLQCFHFFNAQGKTRIAVELLRYMLEKLPNQSVLFIVPTKALVIQQIRVIQQDLPTTEIIEVNENTSAFTQSGCVYLGVAGAFDKAFSLGSLKVLLFKFIS